MQVGIPSRFGSRAILELIGLGSSPFQLAHPITVEPISSCRDTPKLACLFPAVCLELAESGSQNGQIRAWSAGFDRQQTDLSAEKLEVMCGILALFGVQDISAIPFPKFSMAASDNSLQDAGPLRKQVVEAAKLLRRFL